MFVSLGQVIPQSPTAWSDQASVILALADEKKWIPLLASAAELAAKAIRMNAIPVATASIQIQGAAKIMSEDGDATDMLEQALRALTVAARREDGSTVPDRIRNEELLDRRMDEFERKFADWRREHSGFVALWDKIRGGPDLSPFKTTLDDVQTQIDVVPLTTEGRQRLKERHDRLVAGLQPGDWKILVVTGVGALVLNVVFSNAGTIAKGAVVAARSRSDKAKPKRDRDDRPRKKKRRRKVDED